MVGVTGSTTMRDGAGRAADAASGRSATAISLIWLSFGDRLEGRASASPPK
jgi:hypothetical protein